MGQIRFFGCQKVSDEFSQFQEKRGFRCCRSPWQVNSRESAINNRVELDSVELRFYSGLQVQPAPVGVKVLTFRQAGRTTISLAVAASAGMERPLLAKILDDTDGNLRDAGCGASASEMCAVLEGQESQFACVGPVLEGDPAGGFQHAAGNSRFYSRDSVIRLLRFFRTAFNGLRTK